MSRMEADSSGEAAANNTTNTSSTLVWPGRMSRVVVISAAAADVVVVFAVAVDVVVAAKLSRRLNSVTMMRLISCSNGASAEPRCDYGNARRDPQ